MHKDLVYLINELDLNESDPFNAINKIQELLDVDKLKYSGFQVNKNGDNIEILLKIFKNSVLELNTVKLTYSVIVINLSNGEAIEYSESEWNEELYSRYYYSLNDNERWYEDMAYTR